MRRQQSSVFQSSAPPAAPRPCRPQGLVVSLYERLSSPGYLPSCHFLLYLSQQGVAPNGPNIPGHLSPVCLHCCWESPPPFPFSIHSTLRGTLRKTHWLEFYPSLSTVPSPFSLFLSYLEFMYNGWPECSPRIFRWKTPLARMRTTTLPFFQQAYGKVTSRTFFHFLHFQSILFPRSSTIHSTQV